MNMKMPLVAIGLLIALFGCKKKGVDPVYYMRYKVNGTLVENPDNESTPGYIYWKGTTKQYRFSRSYGNNTLIISLQDAAITGSTYTGGTYQLTEVDTCGAKAELLYLGNTKTYETDCAGTGSIQLHYDAGKKEVRGTFSTYVPAVDTSNGSPVGVNITDGELYLRLHVE